MQIRIHVPSQTLDLIEEDEVIRCYAVSTSRFGIGSEPGSYKTPEGRFRIAEKIGDGAPPGEIFVSREPTGQIGEESDEHDHVQTRILWLEGLEPDNANTHDRYIYIHGTNAESQIGTPASFGCVRLNNLDVIDLYDRVTVGAPVEIQA
jgi:L,D-transpeptidase YbiS